MNILYLGYWNINDPLTHSTIFPHLKILSSFTWVNEIVFVNIERELVEVKELPFLGGKIIYRPYHSVSNKYVFIEKLRDFVTAPVFIARLIAEYRIDLIIARGAPAGGLAYLVWRKISTPFFVESFEPHAEYMIEAGIWKRWDPRAVIELILERKQKKLASGLMPVANNFSDALEKSGVNSQRIRTVPCVVDEKYFLFSAESRRRIRQQLNIPDKSIVGIYAGRYGGLYMEQEVFRIYTLAFNFFGHDFHLILLTPTVYHNWINQQIKVSNLPVDRIHLRSVSHHEVPAYLSGGDFAFATYKPGKAMAYLSPVKIGEYWANGLPVILTEGVGDEDRLIREHPWTGVLFHPVTLETNGNKIFGTIKELVASGRENNELVKLAHKHRNPQFTKDAYEYFLKPKPEKLD